MLKIQVSNLDLATAYPEQIGNTKEAELEVSMQLN
jgi:hypothetical protein